MINNSSLFLKDILLYTYVHIVQLIKIESSVPQTVNLN